jgi:flagellar protein FliO/FliZ
MPSSAFSSLLGFMAVLAMIPLALWLLKRTPMGGATTQGLMRSVSAMPLSQNQRLVTVEVGQGDQRRWLVLGITAQNITTLHVMEPGPELPAATGSTTTPPIPFAQLLNRLRRDTRQGPAQ